MKFNTISVIGLGYIGLPTAALLASRGNQVVGVDINQRVVDSINAGDTHIVEPDLDVVVRDAVAKGYLKATTKVEPADAFLICVPTPFKNNFKPDLSYIEATAKSIAPVLKTGNLVILESTSPVGTTEQLSYWLKEMRDDLTCAGRGRDKFDIHIAHYPERVLPGNIFRELVNNDRIIGGMTEQCCTKAKDLYEIFLKGDCIMTDVRTAEMCKLVENSFRDVNIAFANELSIICNEFGINIWELISLANRHPRVDILQPGPGVGGHCIAVDPWFIVNQSPNHAKLIRAAREVNSYKPRYVAEKISKLIEEKERNLGNKPTIVFFGITYKPNTDDLRESAALEIIEEICENSEGVIKVVEPNINKLPKSFKNIKLHKNEIAEADIRVFLVNHEQFSKIEYNPKSDLDFCGIFQGHDEH